MDITTLHGGTKQLQRLWNQHGKSEFEKVIDNRNFGKFLNNKTSTDLKLHSKNMTLVFIGCKNCCTLETIIP